MRRASVARATNTTEATGMAWFKRDPVRKNSQPDCEARQMSHIPTLKAGSEARALDFSLEISLDPGKHDSGCPI